MPLRELLQTKTFKVCNVCKQNKDLESFYNSKATKDGKTYTCKVCTREYSSSYKKKNKKAVKAYSQKYLKQYYKDNREDRLRWQKEYRERNIECRRQYDREQSKKYYQNNKEYFLEKVLDAVLENYRQSRRG